MLFKEMESYYKLVSKLVQVLYSKEVTVVFDFKEFRVSVGKRCLNRQKYYCIVLFYGSHFECSKH